MIKNLVSILMIENMPLLLSWTIALYMVIGASIELDYRYLKSGLIVMVTFFFCYSIISDTVYENLGLVGQAGHINLTITTVLLASSFIGLASGKAIDRYVTKRSKKKDA